MLFYRKEVKKFVPPAPTFTEEELEAMRIKAIMKTTAEMIQKMERARQCRLYFNDLNKIHLLKKSLGPGKKPPPPPDPELLAGSALHIQRLWRGHCAREYVRRREIERRLLIGKFIFYFVL